MRDKRLRLSNTILHTKHFFPLKMPNENMLYVNFKTVFTVASLQT